MVQLLIACGGSSAIDGVGARQQEGRGLQGRGLQGRSLQGTETAVSVVQSITLGGVSVGGLQLQGTLLKGSLGGTALAGADFVGATVVQQNPDGSVFNSTITAVATDSMDASGELLLYTLTAYNPSTGTYDNICDPDPYGGSYAIPVYGTWDSTATRTPSTTQFVFACTSGVIAKCMRWGYKPWKSVNGVSLADYHQTCTRMARADYCGDGVSHTENNTLIDMYDDLGIQTQSPPDLLSPLVFDAAWSAQGAYCVTKDRWLELSGLVTVTLACKLKFVDLFPLVTSSPVSPLDVCAVKRSDVARSSVRMDNQSAANISLF